MFIPLFLGHLGQQDKGGSQATVLVRARGMDVNFSASNSNPEVRFLWGPYTYKKGPSRGWKSRQFLGSQRPQCHPWFQLFYCILSRIESTSGDLSRSGFTEVCALRPGACGDIHLPHYKRNTFKNQSRLSVVEVLSLGDPGLIRSVFEERQAKQ